MNRCVLLLAFMIVFGCDKKETSCVTPSNSVSGMPLTNVFLTSDTLRGTLLFPSEVLRTDICNPVILSGLDTSRHELLLDSAVLNKCQSCLEIYGWSGPGCDPGLEYSNSESPFINTVWKFNHLIFENERLFNPCYDSFQVTFTEDNLAEFEIANWYTVGYEVNRDELYFEKDPKQTLAITSGYRGDLEDIFNLLFTETPVSMIQSGNRLILTHGSGTQFVFFAE